MSLVGNLEDLGLGEILQIVSLSRKSGTLLLNSRGRKGMVVFRQGQVIRATSSTNQESLGKVLIRKGVTDPATVNSALARQEAEGFRERLGAILVRHHGVNPEVIDEVVREQIENVVYGLFGWFEGAFEFEVQDNVEAVDKTQMDPMQFMLDQGLNPQFLAMEGSRILDEKRHRGELMEDSAGDELNPPSEDSLDIDLAFDLLIDQQLSPEPVSTPAAPAAMPIVLVDDDTATRESVSALLVENGYQVFSFARSEDTLVKVDTLHRNGETPALILDLIMPRMDGSGVLGGLELLEMVHANFPELPVLVMSDYENAEAEKKVLELGYGFIPKPRRVQIADAAAVREFAGRFLPLLRKAISRTQGAKVQGGVNIGDELRLEMGEDFIPAQDAAAGGSGMSLLRGMLEELNNPSLGGGIILLVLRFASEFMSRAVIFIVKRDEIVGLGQFGLLDRDGTADSRIRNMRIPRKEESIFSCVIESKQPAVLKPTSSPWDRYLIEHLGGEPPGEMFLGPIVSEGRVVAVLYGDNNHGGPPITGTESLEIFLSQAGIAMEKALLVRKLKEKDQEGR